jgi:hypothetical protein
VPRSPDLVTLPQPLIPPPHVVPQPHVARSEGDALGRPPIDVPRCTRHRNRIPFRTTTDFIALEFSRCMCLHTRLPSMQARDGMWPLIMLAATGCAADWTRPCHRTSALVSRTRCSALALLRRAGTHAASGPRFCSAPLHAALRPGTGREPAPGAGEPCPAQVPVARVPPVRYPAGKA